MSARSVSFVSFPHTRMALLGALLAAALCGGCTYRTATVVTGSNTVGGTVEAAPCADPAATGTPKEGAKP